MAINLKLISRLIGLNALTFSEGEFKIWNVAMMFFPYQVTAFIQHEFEEKFGKKARDILYYIGKLQAYNGTMLMIKQFGIKNPESMYDLFGEQAAMVGVGRFQITSIDAKNKHIVVECKNNPYMTEYIRTYGQTGTFSDDYLRGLVAGAAEAAFGGDLVAIESKCIAKGDDHCVIEINEKTKWDLKNPLVKEQMPSDMVDYHGMLKKLQLTTLVKSNISYGEIASNFFKTKKVKFGEDGKFYLMDVAGMSKPMDTCVMFINTFNKFFGDDGKKILYEAGELLAKTLMKEKPLSVSQLNLTLSNWQTFGFGHLEVIRCDEKAQVCQTKLSNHVFAKHYKKIFGIQKIPVDSFMSGLVNGVLEIFHERKLSTRETQCTMQGKSEFCYFETTAKN